MNILITGGAGFIGSKVAHRLVEEGHFVRVLDNFSNSYRNDVHGRFVYYVADITNPTTAVPKYQSFYAAFEDIDLVIHCAAVADINAPILDCFQTNVIGGMNVLEEMARRGIKKIINASSAAVYGDTSKQPISINTPCEPINDYGLSKLLFEQILNHYERRYGIQHTSFRYFNVVGPGENRKQENHLIYRTLMAAKRGEAIGINGDGTCVRDYVHVDDVAEAHVQLINQDKWPLYLNVGSGQGFSVEYVVNQCAKVVGHDIHAIEQPYREGDPLMLIANISKTNILLGWDPTHSLDDIIKDTWEWINRKETHGQD